MDRVYLGVLKPLNVWLFAVLHMYIIDTALCNMGFTTGTGHMIIT